MNRCVSWVCLSALAALMAFPAPVHAQRKGVDLLVLPARYTTLQVAFDLAARRDVVLVAYQTRIGRDQPVLHVWDGVAWIPISTSSFANFDFTRTYPRRVVLVGDAETLPRSLVEAAVDGPADRVIEIATQETADLLNGLAQVYRFRSTEWEWFGSRYQLDLSDANAQRRRTSWYDQKEIDRSTAPWNRRTRAARGSSGPEATPDPSAVSQDLPRPAPAGGFGPVPAAADFEASGDLDNVEDTVGMGVGEGDAAPAPAPMEPAPMMGPETVFESPIK